MSYVDIDRRMATSALMVSIRWRLVVVSVVATTMTYAVPDEGVLFFPGLFTGSVSLYIANAENDYHSDGRRLRFGSVIRYTASKTGVENETTPQSSVSLHPRALSYCLLRLWDPELSHCQLVFHHKIANPRRFELFLENLEGCISNGDSSAGRCRAFSA
jgi:hypothetical protein